MSRIKNETGTSIIIPPDESKSSVIRIEGDPKGVAAAKAMLLEMSAKMVCKGGREGERERERGREGEREGGREGWGYCCVSYILRYLYSVGTDI